MRDLLSGTEEMLQIDRSNWTKVKFGSVAIQQKKSVDREKTNLTFYVKGEHMSSQDLHLREWGELKDEYLGPAFIRYFEEGDILYGSRRTYLRKVSIAPFEGITSNTTFVIKANDKLIDKRLLPFVMLSEGFTEHSIKNSKGSVNPYVNWKDLANYEFLLPPKEEQAKLAELLWAMDEVIEKEKAVFNYLDLLFKAKIKLISDEKLHRHELQKIKDVCVIKDNQRKPLNSLERDTIKGDIPYYGANGLVDNINDFIFNEDLVLIAEDGGNFNEFFYKEIAYPVKGKSWVNNHAHVLAVKKNSIPIDWLYFSLVHKNILKHIIGTTRLKLNKSELEQVKIWIPSIEIIEDLVNKLNLINQRRRESSQVIKNAKSLQKSLINQIF